jgi:outer membrane receptor for ferric coprogen and ferric-rhodotorulic acid
VGALPLYNSDGSATSYPVSTSTAARWSNWTTSDARSFVELAQRLDSGWQLKAVLSQRLLRSEGDLFYAYGTPDASTGLGLYSYPSYYRSREKQTLVDAYASGPSSSAGAAMSWCWAPTRRAATPASCPGTAPTSAPPCRR